MNECNKPDIRNIKCGFRSLYLALVCRNSPVLTQFGISSIYDLYTLIIHGNDRHSSMFETMCTQSWLADHLPLPYNCTWHYYLVLYKKLIIETGGVTEEFLIMAAVYFNLHIVLHIDAQYYADTKQLERDRERVCNVRMMMSRITNPTDTISLSFQPKHLAYIPLPEEKNIFETVHRKIKCSHMLTDELESSDRFLRAVAMDDDDELDIPLDHLLNDDGNLDLSKLLAECKQRDGSESM